MKGLNTSEDAGSLVERSKDVRTACVVLDMDSDAFEKLQRTQALFRRACNLLVDIIREDTEKKLRLWQRYNLHHAGYYRVREAVPELGAQLVCNAVRAVSAAYKTLLSNNSKYAKDKKLELPKIVFKNVGIHLDARTLTFSKDRTTASVFTSQKRVSVRASAPELFNKIFCRTASGASVIWSTKKDEKAPRDVGSCISLLSAISSCQV